MDLVCYERAHGLVLEHFRAGEFDYLDAANEVMETDFFRFIQAHKYLEALAATYPSPRLKHDIPTWFYLASNLSMRLHGVHSFHAYPYVVRSGGMLNAFGPELGRKTTHPQTGDVTLACGGFNDKNHYQRQTPVDQDALRKLARDTNPAKLEQWCNREIPRLWHQHKLFAKTGTWIGDASYIFVPDNDKYEGAVRLLFDEHDHPVEADRLPRMSPQAAARCQWRRCYKLVSLLYVDPQRRFTLRVALRVLPGNANECPVLYELVDDFVAHVSPDLIRRLLLDRGFIDGAQIARCKRDYGIDILIPVRANMDVYLDAMGLVQAGEVRFAPYQPPAPREPLEAPRLPEAPPVVQQRERKRQRTVAQRKAESPPPPPAETVVRTEVAAVENTRSFTTCSVPLNVIVNREVYGDGHTDVWMLLDTRPLSAGDGAAQRRAEYGLRTEIEEGHRQLKCFWDLTRFTAQVFSLVLNQVVFVVLAFNLLQIFLYKQESRPLTRRARPRTLDLLGTTVAVIIIYYGNYFTTLAPLEYTELLLTLAEEARGKVLEKTRRLRRELEDRLKLARLP
jgi:hypothetical protein